MSTASPRVAAIILFNWEVSPSFASARIGTAAGLLLRLAVRIHQIDTQYTVATMVLGVAFGSGFGPVSAMESGLFGPGTRIMIKSPVFQWNFGVKQKTNQKSRREIELFVLEEVSG